MILTKNKKGMFFTVMTLAILSLFIVSLGISSYVKDRTPLNSRIETMNNFVFSVEKDFPRKLYLSGFRTIFLMGKGVAETGDYFSDFESTFEDIFYNGTLNGVNYSEPNEIMYKSTYQGIINSLSDKAKKINMNLSFENPILTIGQEDPWNVKISLEGDLSIQDLGNLASWNKFSVFEAYIPITNFDDPLYLVETNGLVTNKINKTIYNIPVPLSDLSNHAGGKYYINSTISPSFINRFEGNKGANENGIESLVYLPDLSTQGISVKDKSVVDYIYFSTNNPSTSNIAGMPAWFKLDTNHLGLYGV